MQEILFFLGRGCRLGRSLPVALPFAFAALAPLAQSKLLDRVVAVVQGKPILHSDVKSLVEQIRGSELLRSFYRIDGGITDQSVLNRLVEDQIIRARLKELGAEVSGDTVNREITEIAKKNQLSTTQLKAMLAKQKVEFENYFEALKSQIERRAIYAREISTSGSTLTDEELKTLYRNRAPPEFKMSLISDANTAQNKKLLNQIATQFKAGKLSVEKLKEHPHYLDLGWLSPEDVADVFKKKMGTATVGQSVGPLVNKKQVQVLFIEDSRRGSDDQFEKVKEVFRGSVEEVEVEKKFASWFEKQRNQLEVTINSI